MKIKFTHLIILGGIFFLSKSSLGESLILQSPHKVNFPKEKNAKMVTDTALGNKKKYEKNSSSSYNDSLAPKRDGILKGAGDNPYSSTSYEDTKRHYKRMEDSYNTRATLQIIRNR